jgi:hypothetical protein
LELAEAAQKRFATLLVLRQIARYAISLKQKWKLYELLWEPLQ